MPNDFKANLITVVADRASWAINDSATYLFAKCMSEWSDYPGLLGGGNMAKPLILFTLWDVLAGVYVFCSDHYPALVWTEAARIAAGPAIQEATQALALSRAAEGVRVLKPKPGQIKDDAKAMRLFLAAFQSRTNLGVTPSVFANTVRQEFRNKLAHTFAPLFGQGTESTGARAGEFENVLARMREDPSPIVVKDESGMITHLNAIAMLRDSEHLRDETLSFVASNATPVQAQSALEWLGYPTSQPSA